jgi:recombinational DNA repair protein RecT
MTTLLQEAFHKASELSIDLQDEIARQLIEEIEWELRWDTTLEASQNVLEQLAKEAMQEYKAGETVELGFDEL